MLSPPNLPTPRLNAQKGAGDLLQAGFGKKDNIDLLRGRDDGDGPFVSALKKHFSTFA